MTPRSRDPTKPIGPIYTEEEVDRLAEEKGWVFKPDGDSFRRVVPSPLPQRIFGIEPIQWLLEHGASSSAPAAAAFRSCTRTSRRRQASSSASRL